MVFVYIALGASILVNIILATILIRLKKKHNHTAQQLHFYNVCASGRHVD